MMGLDLDVSWGDESHRDGGDDEPEGEREEGLLIREHVQKCREPGVELVKRLYRAFLFPERWNEMINW